jgi:hypothetical protein
MTPAARARPTERLLRRSQRVRTSSRGAVRSRRRFQTPSIFPHRGPDQFLAVAGRSFWKPNELLCFGAAHFKLILMFPSSAVFAIKAPASAVNLMPNSTPSSSGLLAKSCNCLMIAATPGVTSLSAASRLWRAFSATPGLTGRLPDSNGSSTSTNSVGRSLHRLGIPIFGWSSNGPPPARIVALVKSQLVAIISHTPHRKVRVSPETAVPSLSVSATVRDSGSICRPPRTGGRRGGAWAADRPMRLI